MYECSSFFCLQSEEILVRKNRLELVRQSIDRLRNQVERSKPATFPCTLTLLDLVVDKLANTKSQQSKEKRRLRIQLLGKKVADIKMVLNSSNEEIRKKDESRLEHESKLYHIRRQRLNEVFKYIFHMQHVSSIEE